MTVLCSTFYILLNQARSGQWPVHAWFLKIDPVQIIGIRVCVCARVCACVCAHVCVCVCVHA